MRRGYKPRRCMYTVLSAVVGSTALAPYCVYANTSAANFQMREQVVDLVGIMSVTDATAQVTRADFAEMLVNASSWRENLTSVRRCRCLPMCRLPIPMRRLYPHCRFPGLDEQDF